MRKLQGKKMQKSVLRPALLNGMMWGFFKVDLGFRVVGVPSGNLPGAVGRLGLRASRNPGTFRHSRD